MNVNVYRVVQMVSAVLLAVWMVFILPFVTMLWHMPSISRFIYVNNVPYGLEVYQHLILTEEWFEIYYKSAILSVLPAAVLMVIELHCSLNKNKTAQRYREVLETR